MDSNISISKITGLKRMASNFSILKLPGSRLTCHWSATYSEASATAVVDENPAPVETECLAEFTVPLALRPVECNRLDPSTALNSLRVVLVVVAVNFDVLALF